MARKFLGDQTVNGIDYKVGILTEPRRGERRHLVNDVDKRPRALCGRDYGTVLEHLPDELSNCPDCRKLVGSKDKKSSKVKSIPKAKTKAKRKNKMPTKIRLDKESIGVCEFTEWSFKHNAPGPDATHDVTVVYRQNTEYEISTKFRICSECYKALKKDGIFFKHQSRGKVVKAVVIATGEEIE